MKTINETFTDQEYKELIRIKKGLTWREFILKLRAYVHDEDEEEDSIENEKEVQEENGTGHSIRDSNNGFTDDEFGNDIPTDIGITR